MTGNMMDPKYSDIVRVPSDLPQMPAPGVRQMRELEKSAVREAIALVCEDGAAKLGDWMDRIEKENGAKVAFDCFIKLLEFAQPKLQRVTIEDPDGNAPQMPVINLHFPMPAPKAAPIDVTPEPEA